ncbi:MAG TPA: prolyl oligopeptidase family serine peptidase [Tepidisphaeraceae bacterium]|nr:prolyl oligopeptidase family serine peptidase [Tepidisphaeraceae bacterium]
MPLFRRIVSLICPILLLVPVARAEDWTPLPRHLPPPGIQLDDAQRNEIESALSKLTARLKTFSIRAENADLLPDARIYEKAVRFALLDDEFYSPKDAAVALAEIAEANKRLDYLEHGQHPWATQHGLLVRGYQSAIDGSAQPYGLEIPQGLDLSKPVPLYVWLHGRGDKETDLHFIRGRETHKGQIQPRGAIVLHPFGRQCVGFKFAGEIDVFEAIASVQRRYKIDPDRVVLMGFSMGGAGAWHIGAHYADDFAAVHAGAGFVDVAQYQHLKPAQYPAWYEQKLWGMYDVPDYARNLFNVPTVAYGGEIDPQRASSAIMAQAFADQGHTLVRIVGPRMPHRYDPASLAQIIRLMDDAVKKGRDRFPKQLSLQTRTLRYNHIFWASLTGLKEHWRDSRLDAQAPDDSHIIVTTRNARGLSLRSPWPDAAGDADREIQIRIDGSPISVRLDRLRLGHARFVNSTAGWGLDNSVSALSTQHSNLAQGPMRTTLHKIHGLQGPIDDAFMEPFLVVTPGGRCASAAAQKWMDFELKHFQDRWRQLFRGDLPMKKDTDVTPDDIRRFNLILWGDGNANRLIGQVMNKLPIRWSAGRITVGTKQFDAATHLPLAIYPNPLNPQKYIVLNSGFTFREDSDKTNSLQNPKLPDWAIIDITAAPGAHYPGKVEEAGFFDEGWKLMPFGEVPAGQR